MSIRLTAIVAMTPDRVIGRAGTLPWHLPEDLAFFKRTTSGHPIVMGRKTYESIGRPLPKRRNIVLTRDPAWRAEGAEIVRSGKEAIAAAASERLSVIGGAEIYALMLPHADRIELTEVDAEPAGDTFVPAFDSAIWRESAREVHPAAEGRPGFSFVTLLRR